MCVLRWNQLLDEVTVNLKITLIHDLRAEGADQTLHVQYKPIFFALNQDSLSYPHVLVDSQSCGWCLKSILRTATVHVGRKGFQSSLIKLRETTNLGYAVGN